MPNPSGVNRRKRPTRPKAGAKKAPRFLRRVIIDYGSGAPAKVLGILAWAIALWFVAVVIMGDTGFFSILGLRSMRSDLEDRIGVLEDARAAATQRRDDLENDPWTIEKVAREECGMIKDGEIVYRLSEEPTDEE